MKQITVTLVSNMPKGPRNEVYYWGRWDEGSAKIVEYLKAAKTEFELKRIRWYCLFLTVLDTDEASVTTTVLANASHEEVPPLELNVAAKGFKPVPKPTAKKKTGWAGVAAAYTVGNPIPAAAQMPVEFHHQDQEGNQF